MTTDEAFELVKTHANIKASIIQMKAVRPKQNELCKIADRILSRISPFDATEAIGLIVTYFEEKKLEDKMATINDKELIREIIEADGKYQDDAIPVAMYTYLNMNNTRTYAINYTLPTLSESMYCRQPELLWSRSSGKTEAYKKYFEEENGSKVGA